MSHGQTCALPASFAQLLRSARAGSTDALGSLFEGFRRYLLGIGEGEIRPDLQAKGGASDLVQETFLCAHQAFPRFEGESPEEVGAWLRKIYLRNLSGFRRRYVLRQKRASAREVRLDMMGHGVRLRNAIADSGPAPDSEAIRREQTTRLQIAINSLPTTYQCVVKWHSRDRRSFESIGAELGCSAEAARKIWGRALRCLAIDAKP